MCVVFESTAVEINLTLDYLIDVDFRIFQIHPATGN